MTGGLDIVRAGPVVPVLVAAAGDDLRPLAAVGKDPMSDARSGRAA